MRLRNMRSDTTKDAVEICQAATLKEKVRPGTSQTVSELDTESSKYALLAMFSTFSPTMHL